MKRRLTYMGVVLLKNERHANACQLVALDALAKAEPQLRQMPGHDGARERALVEEGLLTAGFH